MQVLRSPPVKKALPFAIGLALLIPACGSPATSVPSFIAPTSQASPTPDFTPTQPLPPQPELISPTSTGEGLSLLPSPTPVCTDGLRFVQDVNYPDNTPVQPGESLTKGWLVQNDGTCDWDSRYRFSLTGGLPMGTDGVQALYPARAGTQPTLQITLVAPDQPGTYRSEWRAFGPTGQPFGDTLYIQIVVTP
jgi:hypothetical protein